MIKNTISLAMMGMAVLGLNACKNDGGFKKTKTGLEYKIIKDEKKGSSPGYGDMVTLFLNISYGDSTVFDTKTMNGGQPLEMPLMEPMFKGDWPEGLTLLTEGDSAIFNIPVDTIRKYSQMQGQGELPPYMKDGNKITYAVKLVSFKSKAQQESAAMQQKDMDDKMLQDYFTKNNIAAQKTNTGLYYIIDKPGSGANAQAGQDVTVMYTGKTMDGNAFDSNIDPKFNHTDPLTFQVGRGQVIPGWDEGIMLMNKGAKGRLFIPSTLAYGPQERPGLPANSILIFDVEIKDVKDPAPMPVQ
jgi:FKBP-type peptidyl-prolyl cis-trans isomerase FkpA